MVSYYNKTNGKLNRLDGLKPSCWININPPIKSEELTELSSQLNIPLDFLTDPLDIDERPRYEKEEDVRLIVISTPILNEGYRDDEATFITVPIGIILHPNHIITITSTDNTILEMFLDNKVKNFLTIEDNSFVIQIFEQNVHRFLSCLKKLNLKRNMVEKELYDSSKNQDLHQLLSIQKSLIYFVNSLSANEMLKLKIKRTDFLGIRNDEDKTELLEDIIIDNSQALEMSNVYTNILNSTMETYSSIISNNLGMIMQRLTLITIILMVPTLVASLYGMNVDVPFGHTKYAFFLILIVSSLFSIGLAYFFRRKRLL